MNVDLNYLALKIQQPDGAGNIWITPPVDVPVGGLHVGGGSSLQSIIQNSTTVIIVLAIILALFFLLWGGIQWIMSQGDKHKVEVARNRIIYSLIGLVVIFLSFFIINIIGNIFGINLLNIRNVECHKVICG